MKRLVAKEWKCRRLQAEVMSTESEGHLEEHVVLQEHWPAFSCVPAPTCQALTWSQVHLSPPTDFPRQWVIRKAGSQMSFSKSHFCTLQLGPVLTIRHNLWTPLWWPNKRKQQEQTLTGDKTRARHNLARSSIPSRGHSSHLTPYLKPSKAARKHANSLPQLAIKHTSCNSLWLG